LIGHPDKKSTKKLELNDSIDLMDLTDIYRAFHAATAQYTFFSATHGTCSKIDHSLGHKASLNKCRKTVRTPAYQSDNNTMELELNSKRNSRKYSNNCQLKNMLLSEDWSLKK
jgi:exonuclease III